MLQVISLESVAHVKNIFELLLNMAYVISITQERETEMGVNKTLDFKIFHVSSSSHVFYTIHHSYTHSCLSFKVDTKIVVVDIDDC